MKHGTIVLCAALLALFKLSAETTEYSFESYMNRDYHVTDKNILPLTYYIIASKPKTLDEGFSYLKSGEEGPFRRSKVFSVMGRLLSAYPTDKYNAEIKSYVKDVERSYGHYSEVIDAYTALAKIGTEQTLEMLKKRSTFEFWEGREIPSQTSAFSDRPNELVTDNAQSAAISALGKHPSPEAKAFLENLQKDERYIDDPVLKENEAFKMALQFATKEGISYRQNQIDEALALKESIFGSKQAVEATKEQATKISPPTPESEATEKTEKVADPSTEKPADIQTPDTSEEPTEQSSNWWLWLIGAVIVVGGLGLVVRRKS